MGLMKAYPNSSNSRSGSHGSAAWSAGEPIVFWVFTTLPFALMSYGVGYLSYRTLKESFPPPSQVLGRGDLLLVVLSVVGATTGEALREDSAMSLSTRLIGVAVSFMTALVAIGVFGGTIYSNLVAVGPGPAFDYSFIMTLSLLLLAIAILTHLVFLIYGEPE